MGITGKQRNGLIYMEAFALPLRGFPSANVVFASDLIALCGVFDSEKLLNLETLSSSDFILLGSLSDGVH